MVVVSAPGVSSESFLKGCWGVFPALFQAAAQGMIVFDS